MPHSLTMSLHAWRAPAPTAPSVGSTTERRVRASGTSGALCGGQTALTSAQARSCRRNRAVATRASAHGTPATAASHDTAVSSTDVNAIRPLKVLVAGGGIGGLVLAKGACAPPHTHGGQQRRTTATGHTRSAFGAQLGVPAGEVVDKNSGRCSLCSTAHHSLLVASRSPCP